MVSERIRRLLRLACAIQSGRVSGVDELAALAGVSRRTIFRDLEALAESGLKYPFDRGRGCYTADQPALLPVPKLSVAEGTALLLAARHMLSSSMFPDRKAATNASLKLESILPKRVREKCVSLVRRMAIYQAADTAPNVVRDMMPLLQQAIADQFKLDVAIDSHSGGKVINARLHPYYLVHVDQTWKMVAFVEKRACFELLTIEDFVRVRVIRSSFIIDANCSLDRFFDSLRRGRATDNHHHVAVRFGAAAWNRVTETTWHPTQRITYGQDGSMLFQVDADELDAITGWILSFGDVAEVVEPIELRTRIATCAKRMSCAYATPNGLGQPASQSA